MYVNELFPRHACKWVQACKPQACCWAHEVFIVSLFCRGINYCLNQEQKDAIQKDALRFPKQKSVVKDCSFRIIFSLWYDTSRHCYCKVLCALYSLPMWKMGSYADVLCCYCHLRSHYQDPADENRLSKHDASFHHDVWGTTVPVLFISSLLCYHLRSHYQDPADENKVGKHDVGFHCDVWGTTVDDDDCFSVTLFSALQQTHCARTWFYMSE